MRIFILALAIAVASFAQVRAMPIHVPTTYPAPGVFCGFMVLCTPKGINLPRPSDKTKQDKP